MKKWNLKTKIIVVSILVATLPVISLGVITYYISIQSLKDPITQVKQTGDFTKIEEIELALQQQLGLLALVTGGTALLAGGISVRLSYKIVNHILKASQASGDLVSRLHQETKTNFVATQDQGELSSLENNLNLIAQYLPHLLWKQEAKEEWFQIFININRQLWASFSEEDLFKTTVEEVRQALKSDRVVIFRFDHNWEGTFVAESIAPIWPKMLWATVTDPNFGMEYTQGNQVEGVKIINNIYQAGLSDDHIGFLERFAVKTSLIAPLSYKHHLFGLLIVHQCSTQRPWQPSEIDLLAQIATQMGLAFEHIQRIQRLDAAAEQSQLFTDITLRLRESIREEDVLKITVEEVRQTLKTDRVIVYQFDADWYGTVVAESVLPGFPKALWAEIRDPCFAEGYVEFYQQGRIQAVENVHEAGLTECHLKQLEPFEVKANLVAPILKDDRLFGLLIAHQCSAPRVWQQSEMDLVAQLAIQVGLALDHARLLEQVDTELERTHLLARLVLRLRESIREEDVLKITVEEVRQALKTDRVIVYRFDADWYGTVVAESVLPGFPKALWAEIKDPCFAEGYVDSYQKGRIQAVENIYEAGLTECHLKQLEPFRVKANLVAPILKDDQLFGLLIAHQCSAPRVWQQSEINLLSLVATQVGLALDLARLLSVT